MVIGALVSQRDAFFTARAPYAVWSAETCIGLESNPYQINKREKGINISVRSGCHSLLKPLEVFGIN